LMFLYTLTISALITPFSMLKIPKLLYRAGNTPVALPGLRYKIFNPLYQPFTKDHHITLQSIKSEAITMLKVVILAMCFEGDITLVISELKAKVSLREFTGF